MNANNNDNALPYEYDSNESIVGERKPQNQTSLRLRHLALNAKASGILNSYLAGLVHELGEMDTNLEVIIAFATAVQSCQQTVDDDDSESDDNISMMSSSSDFLSSDRSSSSSSSSSSFSLFSSDDGNDENAENDENDDDLIELFFQLSIVFEMPLTNISAICLAALDLTGIRRSEMEIATQLVPIPKKREPSILLANQRPRI